MSTTILDDLAVASRLDIHLRAALVMRSWAAIKVRESDGQNRGPVVDAIHEIAGGDDEDAAAWCARCVRAAWIVAGWACQCVVDPRVSTSGSVFNLLHQTEAKAHDLATFASEIRDPMTQIRVGDAMIRYTVRHQPRPGVNLTRDDTELGHTEMVVRVYPDGYIDTIGGNTGSQYERDGNGVFYHTRLYHLGQPVVAGFVRPAWVSVDPGKGT